MQAFQENDKKRKEDCECSTQIQCIVKNSSEVFYACPATGNENSFESTQYIIDPVQKPKTSWIAK